MATYNSTAISLSKPIPGEGAGGGQEKTQYAEITVPAGATTADVFNLFDIPRRARVIGFKIDTDALGGGTVNVGDTGTYLQDGTAGPPNAARYAAGVAVTAAGVQTINQRGGIYFYTGNGNGANRNRVRVQMTLATGPTTTGGIVKCNLSYTTEEPQQP